MTVHFFIKQLLDKKNRYFERQKLKKENSECEILEKKRQFEKAVSNNPYLQSRALWNDMYGSIQIKLENSYRIIFVLSLVILATIIGLVIIGTQTKIKPMPFIVHGDEVLTVSSARSVDFDALKPKLASYFVKNFIRSARSVSVDGEVNANNRILALSFVTDAATHVLKEFYEKNNPNVIARDYVKNITITSVLENSAHSVNIRWREDSRAVRSGEIVQSNRYIAEVTYQYQTPSENIIILRNNPLGLAITHLAWSLDQNN